MVQIHSPRPIIKNQQLTHVGIVEECLVGGQALTDLRLRNYWKCLSDLECWPSNSEQLRKANSIRASIFCEETQAKMASYITRR
jgi:hypothetical protein